MSVRSHDDDAASTSSDGNKEDETLLDTSVRLLHHGSHTHLLLSKDTSLRDSTHTLSERNSTAQRGKIMGVAGIIETMARIRPKDSTNKPDSGAANEDEQTDWDDESSPKPADGDKHHVLTSDRMSTFNKTLRNLGSLDNDSDLALADELIRQIIENEFPLLLHPNLRDLINIGSFRRNGAIYSPGDWVEIRGPDMVWRLEMITRVLKYAPDEWDWSDPANEGKTPKWNFFYHAGHMREIRAEELRSPEQGLRLVFGTRPWLWQQWACLKIEHVLRFQKGHQDDFASKDVQKYAMELWDQWLEHPLNIEFYELFHDERIGAFGRSELVQHMMKPFKLMDTILEDKETWDFKDDPDISVYTYLSVLGSGALVPAIVFLLQMIIPILLFLQTLKSERDLEVFGYFGDEKFPPDPGPMPPLAQGMAIVVITLYFVKVVPDTLTSFYNTVGQADTCYSRIHSLRQRVWNFNRDRIGQMIGFKIDMHLNTAYVCALYMINILIVINTDDAFEILLNALAFEFIIELDELFPKSRWWDPDRRWISAGSLELVIQDLLDTRALSSPEKFCKRFTIDKDILRSRIPDPYLLKNKKAALKDIQDPAYMSRDERIKFRCKTLSHALNNKNAIEEYEKPTIHIGILIKILSHFIDIDGMGMFEKHMHLYTWSRWDKVLYLPPVPDIEDIFELNDDGVPIIKRELALMESLNGKKFKNFYPIYSKQSEMKRFMIHFAEVIAFKDLFRNLKVPWKNSDIIGFCFRAFDGIVEWLAYIVQIAFPLYTVLCLFAIVVDIITYGVAREDEIESNSSGVGVSFDVPFLG